MMKKIKKIFMSYFQIKSSGNGYVIRNALIWKGSVQKLQKTGLMKVSFTIVSYDWKWVYKNYVIYKLNEFFLII